MNAIFRLVIFLCVSGSVSAEITTPQPGSPERKTILDALRPPLNKLAGRKVLFLHPIIKMAAGWALVQSGFEADDGRELPRQFQSGYTGLVQRTKVGWELRSWIFMSDGNGMASVSKQCPEAPTLLFSQATPVKVRGFHIDEHGIPVVHAGQYPQNEGDDEQEARPKRATSWPDEGQGPVVSSIWKARVWTKRITGDGTALVEFVPESEEVCNALESGGKVSAALRQKLERLKVQLSLPTDKAAFFIPYSVDFDDSEVCAIGLNRKGEIAYVEFWYQKNGYELSDGNMVLRCIAYHGDGDRRRLLAKAVFTPDDLEKLNPDGSGISPELSKVAKTAARQLRNHLTPFPEYARHDAEKNETLRRNRLIRGGEPALYVRLLANGGVACWLSLGENGDGGEDWLEPLAVPVPAAAPASPKSKAKTAPAPRVGTK